MCKLPIRFEDIHKTSARRLLQLEHEELDRLIGQAEYAVDQANTTMLRLQGIKLEKTVREDMPMQDPQNGGAQ